MIKTYELINKLPENPEQLITWIVYNQDMVKSAETLISQLRGEDYMNKVEVVSLDDDKFKKNRNPLSVYLDPQLFNYIGNGNV
jgi:hypothetical protein